MDDLGALGIVFGGVWAVWMVWLAYKIVQYFRQFDKPPPLGKGNDYKHPCPWEDG